MERYSLIDKKKNKAYRNLRFTGVLFVRKFNFGQYTIAYSWLIIYVFANVIIGYHWCVVCLLLFAKIYVIVDVLKIISREVNVM